MGWLDRLKKVASGGAGRVGASPSDEFPTSIDLIHAALVRFENAPARSGGWITLRVKDTAGRQIGLMQYAGDGLVNLCDRDDIDLRALLVAAGREELAGRCDERDSAMFAIADATIEEVAFALELVIVSARSAQADTVVEAEIES